jgi:hypothetical protein
MYSSLNLSILLIIGILSPLSISRSIRSPIYVIHTFFPEILICAFNSSSIALQSIDDSARDMQSSMSPSLSVNVLNMKISVVEHNSTVKFFSFLMAIDLLFISSERLNPLHTVFWNKSILNSSLINIWLSQKMMAQLFEVDVRTINEHLQNIFNTRELDKNPTVRKFRIVQKEGDRNVGRDLDFYNLDAIISVGYRINSMKATSFRIWATRVLKQFAIKGYVLDKKRLENGSFLNQDYFDEVLAEIREIRLSERNLYQKITDIYSTSLDYDKNAQTTKEFFAKVQNKLHYAIHKHTAPELIIDRADSKREYMGLTS